MSDSAAIWTAQDKIAEYLSRITLGRSSNGALGALGAPNQDSGGGAGGISSQPHRLSVHGGALPTQGSRQGAFLAATPRAGGLPSQGSGRNAFYQPHFSGAGGSGGGTPTAQGSGQGTTIWERHLQKQASGLLQHAAGGSASSPAAEALAGRLRRRSLDSTEASRIEAELASLAVRSRPGTSSGGRPQQGGGPGSPFAQQAGAGFAPPTRRISGQHHN